MSHEQMIDCIAASGVKVEPVLCVKRTTLQEMGFTVKTPIGKGHWSAVHDAVFQNRTIALKIGCDLQKELRNLQRAHALHIGPEFINHHTTGAQLHALCPTSSSSSSSFSGDEKQVDLITMEKLGTTLLHLIETRRLASSTWIATLYDLARRCFDRGFLHGDLHNENVITTLNANEFRLIDFSTSSFVTDVSSKKKIYEEWRALFYQIKSNAALARSAGAHAALAGAIKSIESEWLPRRHRLASRNRR